MHSPEKELFNRFEKLSIRYTTYTHPPLFTVEDSRAHASHIPDAGSQCKSLFLKDKKEHLWLLIAHDSTTLVLKNIEKKLGVRKLHFASADVLQTTLGVIPGSVTPFGLINDIHKVTTVILDAALFNFSLVGFHPLRNDATVTLTPSDLLSFIKSCTTRYCIFDFVTMNVVER